MDDASQDVFESGVAKAYGATVYETKEEPMVWNLMRKH